jgi:ribosomal protein S18 acetylase RimI-like enzyme
MSIQVIEADLDNDAHGQALIHLIDSYARGPGGQSAPLAVEASERMISGLRRHPSKLVLLAISDGRYVGAAVCYWLFATFAGKPFLNVHDLTVLPGHRNRGIGTQLLTEAERRARAADCSKLTLEVHGTNASAQRLYERFGFGPWSNPAIYVAKPLS